MRRALQFRLWTEIGYEEEEQLQETKGFYCDLEDFLKQKISDQEDVQKQLLYDQENYREQLQTISRELDVEMEVSAFTVYTSGTYNALFCIRH